MSKHIKCILLGFAFCILISATCYIPFIFRDVEKPCLSLICIVCILLQLSLVALFPKLIERIMDDE